jgi:hypothetical protein
VSIIGGIDYFKFNFFFEVIPLQNQYQGRKAKKADEIQKKARTIVRAFLALNKLSL